MELLRQAAETYTRELLSRIAKDYSLPLDDLLAYADIAPVAVPQTAPPKTPNPFDKPLCQATTSSGTRCRFYARQDGLCGKHALPVDADPGTPRTCVPVGSCSGTTAKGAPCKFAAKTDGLCGTHLRTSRPPTPPTSVRPTSPSPRAVSPVRSRSPTPPPLPKPKPSATVRKAPSPAPNVKPKATTNPSVLEEDPEDPDEVSDSPGLQERLRAILKEASESDDDPDDEDLNLDSLRAALDTVAVSELLSDDEDDEDASTDGEDDD